MNPEVYYAAGGLVLLVVALVLAVLLRGAARFSAELLGGVGALHEAALGMQHELHAVVAKVSELQAPNTLVTRLTELETKVQGAQLTVADVLERFTALANRQAPRQSRA